MSRILLVMVLWSLLPLPVDLCAQSSVSSPRHLSEQELARLKERVAASKARSLKAQREEQQTQEEARIRAQEQALAEEEWEAEQEVQQVSQPSFADLLAHGMGVFQDEMAKKDAEQAAASARIARLREQAEAVERERERQRLQREREAMQERQRQQQLAQQQRAAQTGNAAQETAAQARERQLRENVAAERQRLAAQQQQAAKAEAERQAKARADEQARQQAEQQRIAAERAAAERQRKAEADRVQALRQAAQNLRTSFSGRATTCAGGGKDVLYLQSSRPAKTGCNVSFEARCPGTASGAGIRFSQANYIGASCMGLGDNIRIGTMSCPAEQVRITMTSADCGSGG